MSPDTTPARQEKAAKAPCGQWPVEERYALPVNDFCAKLSISRATFYRMVADGDVRTLRIRSRTLVARSELERLTRVDRQEAA